MSEHPTSFAGLFPKKQAPAWKWHQAPVKTQWGHEMVVADLAIDKDHTVSIYCERDQIAKVEAMFTIPPAAPVQEPDGAATVAGLHASISILSHLVDQQRQLLVEVEDVFGRDGHGAQFEDGESDLIDRVRAQIAAINPPGENDLFSGSHPLRHTTPPAAQPAPVQERPTDEQIIDVLLKARRAELEASGVDTEGLRQEGVSAGWFLPYARAVISAFTPPAAPVQEPVAWLVCSVNSDGALSLEHAAAWQEAAHEHINDAITEHGIEGAAQWVVRPAYTALTAAQRQWAGLTDEDLPAGPSDADVFQPDLWKSGYAAALFDVRAKLREKNRGAA